MKNRFRTRLDVRFDFILKFGPLNEVLLLLSDPVVRKSAALPPLDQSNYKPKKLIGNIDVINFTVAPSMKKVKKKKKKITGKFKKVKLAPVGKALKHRISDTWIEKTKDKIKKEKLR